MASLLTEEDALAVARVLYNIRRRRAARIAAEHAEDHNADGGDPA